MKNKVFTLLSLIAIASAAASAQVSPPAPSAPRSVAIPAIQESKLPNGLTVALVDKKSVPLVTVNMLIRSGASSEGAAKAGLADITASMLTKGTKTRTATEIAEAVEFLGGSIDSGAGWNSSFISVTVTSDKLDEALAILADVALNPKFDEKELDLLKSQMLDGLTYNLKQPSYLANYVASKYSFKEHPAGGTPESIASITRADVESFYARNYRSDMSVIIFAGDVSFARASEASKKLFGSMAKFDQPARTRAEAMGAPFSRDNTPAFGRMLVVDMPKSGQALVGYYKNTGGVGRSDDLYYPATVLNSVLGGGYSSRLNSEIRIKRGLSYGANSNFAWRSGSNNFSTRAQTKNESAAEVAELVLAEIEKLTKASVNADELTPRKSVLTGGFGRNLETTAGLASAIGDLYAFGVPTSEMNAYVTKVNGVTDSQIKSFAANSILGGDVVIVGDYEKFSADLKKRFPNANVVVIKADSLDLNKESLQK